MSDVHVSLETLRKLSAIGGPGFVQQMSELFETHAPARLAQLVQAFSDGDLPAVARAAHALKSSAGNVGAATLYSTAAAIELEARGNQADAVGGRVATLAEQVRAATAALRDAVALVSTESAPLDANGGAACSPRPRLALVEDNPDNRLLVGALLDDRYEIIEYENGIEALDGIPESRPDLVLLDISLPGMDGTEVLARLRSSYEWATLPVIALTAHAMTGDRERFLGLGFDGYITKPIVDEQLLIDAIDALLGARAR